MYWLRSGRNCFGWSLLILPAYCGRCVSLMLMVNGVGVSDGGTAGEVIGGGLCVVDVEVVVVQLRYLAEDGRSYVSCP